MPRYNVTCGNDKWACYTTTAESFLTPFMPREEYEKWRRLEYGEGIGRIEDANVMDFQAAMKKMRLNHPDDADFVRCLYEAGLKNDDEGGETCDGK